MPRIAVKVSHLGKCYQLGARRAEREFLGPALWRKARLPLLAGAQKREIIWALKDVTFEIEQGDSVAFVGSNGAGKSTLLKVLSRITEPTTGRAEIRGRIGSLLEVGAGFHPELTGRENIYLSGSMLGITRRSINCRFDEIVDFSEMEKFLDTPVKFYSSGQYMRLGFAVAVHLEQDVVLVDETLSVGDAGFKSKCVGKMKALCNEGRTLLFVTHAPDSVLDLCNRTIWLDRGSVVQQGKTEDVLPCYNKFASANNLAAI